MLRNARMNVGAATSGDASSAAATGSASAQSGSTAGQSSGSTEGSGRGAAREVRLSAGSGVSLDEHVGHEISVTGELMGAAAGARAPGTDASGGSQAAGGSASGSATGSPRQTNPQGGVAMEGRGATLMVSSVQMISATCSATR